MAFSSMNNTLPVNIDTMSTTSWHAGLPLWLSPISLAMSLAVFLFAQYALGFYNQPSASKPFPKQWTLYHWPVFGSAIRFFSKRVDMVFEGREASPNGAFSMFIGTKHVVVLSGEEGRKTFFQTKGLSLPQGFVELLTGRLSSAQDGDYGFSDFARTFTELIRGRVLTERLPILNLDIRSFCDKLSLAPLVPDSSEWRSVDISDMRLLIFKHLHRIVGATEIAESDSLLRDNFGTFLKFERSTCNTRVIFPWLPTPLYFVRLFSAIKLYMRILNIVNQRNKEQRREEDGLAVLMDKCETPRQAAEFVCTALAASVATTSSTTLWLLTFLAHSPEWRKKCRDEVLRVVEAHQDQVSSSSNAKSGPRAPGDVLASLTLQQWESEFPVIGNCLSETLRLALPGTVFRRNASGADVPIGSSGEVIPKGAYTAYAIADIHQNPQIYPNAHIFDPSRWDRLQADEAGGPASDTYLGFGAGRHLCAGKRLAKLQIKLVVAHILASFDFAPVDGEATMPMPDRNASRLLIPEHQMPMRFKSLQ